MKKILLLLVLSYALPVVAETVSAVTFNPTRMGNYEQLRISRRAIFRGGLHVTGGTDNQVQENTFASGFRVTSGPNSKVTLFNETTTSPVRRYLFSNLTGVWRSGLLPAQLNYPAPTANDKITVDMPSAAFVGYDPNQAETLRSVYGYDATTGLPVQAQQLSGGVHWTGNSSDHPLLQSVVANGGRFGFSGEDGAASFFTDLRPISAKDLCGTTHSGEEFPTNPSNCNPSNGLNSSKFKRAADAMLIWANKLIVRPYSYVNDDWSYLHVRGTNAQYNSVKGNVSTNTQMNFAKELKYENTSSAITNNDYFTSTETFKLAGFNIPFPYAENVEDWREVTADYDSSYPTHDYTKHRETAYFYSTTGPYPNKMLDLSIMGKKMRYVPVPGDPYAMYASYQSSVHNWCRFQWIERLTSPDPKVGKPETVFVLGWAHCEPQDVGTGKYTYFDEDSTCRNQYGHVDPCYGTDPWEPWEVSEPG